MHRSIALLVVSLGLVLPATALADRVVVGPIRGDSRDIIGRRIQSLLSERLDVIPWDEFRAGYQGAGSAAVRAACGHVRARRVVLGDVNSRRSVLLVAMSCETGDVDIQQEVQLINGAPERTALADAMANLVPEEGAPVRRQATPAVAPANAPSVVESAFQPRVGDPEPPPSAPEGSDPDSAAPELPGEGAESATAPRESAFIASATFAGRGSDASLGGGAGLDEETPEASSETSIDAPLERSSLSWLEVALGAGLATRTLEVPILGGDTVGYSGGGYTEVGAQATVFPLGPLVTKRWARMVGLSGAFTKGVAMPESEGTSLETDAVDGIFGLVGRIPFGEKVGFELRPTVAYGFRGFAIATNPDVATFNYRFLRLGAEARLLFLDRRLAIGASGAYRVVFSLGEATDAYGDRSEGAGWDMGGFASFLIGKLFEVSLGGELVTFSGAYAGEPDLEGRPAVTSTDVYPRGFLRAGVVLR
ncbi:MAG: hypothetical protein HYY06_07040 [Deltaproteobacteria bacterium]|nr:hypothetical protein [Deltaproteobacteria bacterium]